jgi:hypothetical protein
VEITLSLRSVLTPQGILPLGFEEHAAARFFLQGTFADKRVLVFLQPGGVLGKVGQPAATGDSDSKDGQDGQKDLSGRTAHGMFPFRSCIFPTANLGSRGSAPVGSRHRPYQVNARNRAEPDTSESSKLSLEWVQSSRKTAIWR